MRYFFVELLVCLLTLGVAWRIGYSLALVPAFSFMALLVVATFTDIDHWIIPDRVSLGGTAMGIVLAAIWPVGLAQGNPLAQSALTDLLGQETMLALPAAVVPVINSVAGAVVGFVSLWLVGVIGSLAFRKEAMGFGDVKLFGMFGAFCGVLNLLYILILACIVGTIVGLAGIVAGRMLIHKPSPSVAPLQMDGDQVTELAGAHPLTSGERTVLVKALSNPGAVGPVRHHLPFGPSLALAALIIYLFHEPLYFWLQDFMFGAAF